MKDFAISLPKQNSEDSWTLPVPENIVISGGGRIEYNLAETDFTLSSLWQNYEKCLSGDEVCGTGNMVPSAGQSGE